MKRIILISIALLTITTTIAAQGLATERLYQKYRGERGVISIYVPGVALKLASKIADLEGPEKELLRSVRSMRVLTIEDASRFPDVNFVKEAKINAHRGPYKVLVEVQDGSDNVLIMGRAKNGKLKDMLVLVGGSDNVMVHIKGKLNADMIGSLASIAGADSFGDLTSM